MLNQNKTHFLGKGSTVATRYVTNPNEALYLVQCMHTRRNTYNTWDIIDTTTRHLSMYVLGRYYSTTTINKYLQHSVVCNVTVRRTWYYTCHSCFGCYTVVLTLVCITV
jgi:hypothetical protein